MTDIYYVYVYLDPRYPGSYKIGRYAFTHKPVYLGKGHANRLWDHLKTARAVFDKQLQLKDSSGSFNKTAVLVSILKSGLTPIVYKLKQLLTEADAVRLEADLICKCNEQYPGLLTNIRTNTWAASPTKRNSSRKGITTGNVGTLANTRRYYDTDRKCHHILTDKELARLVKLGEINPDRLIDLADYRKAERAAKTAHPMKSRAGEMNGMYGKPSKNLGKRWYTVDGQDKLLLPQDAKKLERKGQSVTVGRSKYKEQAFGRGRRLVFEGEIKGCYRSDEYISAHPRKKYQLGLIWAPEKPVYRNHKLVKDPLNVKTRPRSRTTD